MWPFLGAWVSCHLQPHQADLPRFLHHMKVAAGSAMKASAWLWKAPLLFLPPLWGRVCPILVQASPYIPYLAFPKPYWRAVLWGCTRHQVLLASQHPSRLSSSPTNPPSWQHPSWGPWVPQALKGSLLGLGSQWLSDSGTQHPGETHYMSQALSLHSKPEVLGFMEKLSVTEEMSPTSSKNSLGQPG